MSAPRRILQITSYPPPRSGWGIRVQFLKRRLEADGHTCVVLNIGSSRKLPSSEYETVMDGWDYLRKLWRYSRRGFIAHVHVNGASVKGLALALIAELVNLCFGQRCFLTFHAGVEQKYFPARRAPWLVPAFWLVFALPARIICNNESVKARIAAYGIAPDKISAIPGFSRQYLEFQPVALPDPLDEFLKRFRTIILCYLNFRPLFYPVELVEGFARVAAGRHDIGLVMCGISGYPEADVQAAVTECMARHAVRDRICLLGDLDHDEFLTTLTRSAVYVRTHVSDGVCSSLLEAMALGVPVVASENGHRPPGVLTYCATDPQELAARLEGALVQRDTIASRLSRPEIPDTLSMEVQVLVGG